MRIGDSSPVRPELLAQMQAASRASRDDVAEADRLALRVADLLRGPAAGQAGLVHRLDSSGLARLLGS